MADMTLLPTPADTPAPAAWDEFVAAHPGGHLLQSHAWGVLKAEFGWQAEEVRTADACALVLFRRLPMRLGTLAYIPRGPVLDWQDQRSARALLKAVDATCRRHHSALLKIEPWLEDSSVSVERLSALGFRPSMQTVQPPRTVLVDLSPADEEAVLAAMKPKCRYNIRLAERKGVTVHPAARADLPAFHALMAATSARDGFAVHTPEYYEVAYRLLVEENDLGVLLLAEAGGKPLAALFAAALGPLALYLYGASADEGRQLMPTYLLQWEAMRWARARGAACYDLLGVPDEDEATLEAQFEGRQDGLWGVYRFKRGFGGRIFRTVGAWDRVYNPMLYWAYGQIISRRQKGTQINADQR